MLCALCQITLATAIEMAVNQKKLRERGRSGGDRGLWSSRGDGEGGMSGGRE